MLLVEEADEVDRNSAARHTAQTLFLFHGGLRESFEVQVSLTFEEKHLLKTIATEVHQTSEDLVAIKTELFQLRTKSNAHDDRLDRHDYRLGRVERHVGLVKNEADSLALETSAAKLSDFEHTERRQHVSIPIQRAGQLLDTEREAKKLREETETMREMVTRYRWWSKTALRAKDGVKNAVQGAVKTAFKLAVTAGAGALVHWAFTHWGR
jgi:hypothetical protein